MKLGAVLARLRPARSARADLGRRGERAAARHLRRRGYRILGRNVRLPGGEVDLVALAPDRRTVAIVEVKTRVGRDGTSLPPEASVTASKRRTLLKLTDQLIARNGWHDRMVRIDVIAVWWEVRGRAAVRHFESAVTPSSAVRRASRGTRTRA